MLKAGINDSRCLAKIKVSAVKCAKGAGKTKSGFNYGCVQSTLLRT